MGDKAFLCAVEKPEQHRFLREVNAQGALVGIILFGRMHMIRDLPVTSKLVTHPSASHRDGKS